MFLYGFTVAAQITSVAGVIRDDATGETMEGVSVVFPGTPYGVTTNADGFYELSTGASVSNISFSFLGYETVTRPLLKGQNQRIDLNLKEDSKLISEVVIRAQKGRYRNKDNPAVDLIKKVIEHKADNRMSNYPRLQYESYEKLQIALVNPPDLQDALFVGKRFDFVFDNIDSSSEEGRVLFPFFLEENLTHYYQTAHPKRHHSVVKAINRVNYNEDFINIESTKTFLLYLFQDIDIYEDNIRLITNEFLSPIANMAPTFYKFFLTDTVRSSEGVSQVIVQYEPRNTTDKLFRGKLWITLDGNYAVAAAEITVDQSVNLNWVQEATIFQGYDRMEDGRYLLTESKSKAYFGLGQIKNGGAFAERSLFNRNFDWQAPIAADLFRSDTLLEDARNKTTDYWQAARPEPLSKVETKLYENVDSLNKMPQYKRGQFIVSALGTGYLNFKQFEVGPLGSAISFNPLEGLKLRLGGRTRTELNKWLYGNAYVSYGFKDQRWKYLLDGYFSFNGKNVFAAYPMHYFKISANRETSIPGLATQYFSENTVLASIKRGVNDKWLYNDIYQAEYLVEFGNHHQLTLRYNNHQQSAAANLHFISADNPLEEVATIHKEEVVLNWRWAPGEKFVQRKNYRKVVPTGNPIFNVQLGKGFKGFLGGEYDYHFVSAEVYKRFYLSQFGIADVRLNGYYLAGNVPFPLLSIAQANQTYGFDQNAYNLMNFLEFVSDRNLSLSVDYHLYGFLFNKVPLLKFLKWREVVGIKVLYGGLRQENNPNYTPEGLLSFPVNTDGVATTYALGDMPYVELNIGIENILNLVRVDLVRRVNYLYHPEVSKWGVRVGLQFDF